MKRARPAILAATVACLMAVAGCGASQVHDTENAFKDLGVQLDNSETKAILNSTHSWRDFKTSEAAGVLKEQGEAIKEFLDEKSDDAQDAICAIVVYRNESGKWPTDAREVVSDMAVDKFAPPDFLVVKFSDTLSETEDRFSTGSDLDAELQSAVLYCQGSGILKRT
jgi:gas vesicle protein